MNMNSMKRVAVLVMLNGAIWGGSVCAAASQSATPPTAMSALAETILADETLTQVLDRARTILEGDLNAGSGYAEVWIRDLNTFIELALDVGDAAMIREALLVFFHFQGEDGNIIDGYVPASKANVDYKYIESMTRPQFKGHKNTVETDQETSLVQAVYKYVHKTGDRAILEEIID
ncbi:MAG: hypothetical protein GY809_21775, partial [Planctomycetes bacterium]|nr:hypothetical protein [Planctomycetota bacterium]